MASQNKPTLQERRDRALEQMDEGRRALILSLKGLDPEEAYTGSRWAVWEVIKHLDSPEFVDSLEKLASGEWEMLPGFGSRAEHLQQELDRQAATFHRLRSLFASLSEEQLAKPVTPPNPHNSFPGLSMIELIERSVRHEATHAKQIEDTRKYVAEFSAKKRAVTFAGLAPDNPSQITSTVLNLVSYADYVAGASQALEIIRPWIRGIEVELREDNAEEVLSRLGREARSGQWPLVVCLGEPASSCPELIELARRHCAHVAVHPVAGN